MADVSGTLEFSCTNNCKIRLTYSQVSNVSTNKSTLTITKVEFKTGGDWSDTPAAIQGSIKVTVGSTTTAVITMDGTGTNGGRVAVPKTPAYNTVYNNWSSSKTAVSGSITINHNANGTAPSILVTLGSGGSAGFTYFHVSTPNYSGAYCDYTSGSSQTITLGSIPRASSITVATSPRTLGSAHTISVNKISTDSSIKHTLTYSCGSASGTLLTDSTASSVSFTPAISLAAQNTTGTSVNIAYTLITKSGSTQIGTYTTTVSYSIPSSVVPTITSTDLYSLRQLDSLTGDRTYSSSSSMYYLLKDYSKLRVHSFDKTKVSGAQGSTISKYEFSFNGTTNSYTSSTLPSNYIEFPIVTTSDNKTLTVTVTDSRGRTASYSQTIYVLAYTKPTLSGVSIYRSNSSGTASSTGDCITVRGTATYQSISGNDSYKHLTTKIGTGTAHELTNGQYIHTGLSSTTSYSVSITTTDGYSSVSQTVIIPTESVFIHFKSNGMGLGIGKYSEYDNLLDVAWSERVWGDLTVDGGGNITKAASVLSPNIDEEYDATTFHTSGLNSGGTAGTFPSGATRYGAGITLPYRKPHGNQKPDFAGQIYIPNGDATPDSMYFRTSKANAWDAWQRVMQTESYALPASSSVAVPLTANKIYLISGGIGGSASVCVVWMGTSVANCKSAKILDFGGFDIAFTTTGITVSNLRTYAMMIGVLMIS